MFVVVNVLVHGNCWGSGGEDSAPSDEGSGEDSVVMMGVVVIMTVVMVVLVIELVKILMVAVKDMMSMKVIFVI